MDYAYWFCRFCGYKPEYDENDQPTANNPEPIRGKMPLPSAKAIDICPSCRGAANG